MATPFSIEMTGIYDVIVYDITTITTQQLHQQLSSTAPMSALDFGPPTRAWRPPPPRPQSPRLRPTPA